MARSVLHCYADYKWTGPSEPVAVLCRELIRRGWRAELACMGERPGHRRTLPGKAREMGVAVHDDLHFEFDPNLARNLRDIEDLSRLIQAGEFDIVHAHGSWDHVLAAAALWRGPSDAPLVRSDHGGREFRSWPLDRFQFAMRTTDHLIVLSEGLRRCAIERLRRDPETVTTVRGAVDCEKFRPIEPPPGKRAGFGLSADDVVIGLVARVQWHRRFEVLLEAARIVEQRNPRVRIVVLGRGTDKEEILDRPVGRMGLGETVRSLGYRTDDYLETLATFDAGLMLVPGSDASCRAAMQMAAMGKPLVVAERGVLSEIVADGETGIVVKDTPRNLAEAILAMAESEQERRRWGRAARERMQEMFSLECQIAGVAGVYEKLLGRR